MAHDIEKYDLSDQEIRSICREFLGSVEMKISRDQTAWMVSNLQRDSQRRVVLKVPDTDCVTQSSSQMYDLHEKVRCMVEEEDRSIVPILGYDDRKNVIVMEHIDGSPLLKLLRKVLLTKFGGADAIKAIENTGKILADINAIKAKDLGIKTNAKSNESFIRDLSDLSNDIGVGKYLANGNQEVMEFVDTFSEKLKERSVQQLIAVDVQPKNVFLSGNGIVLIDPGYVIGNPAMNVAQVLVSLDQLGMRFPLKGHIRMIEKWKKQFLSAYKESDNSYKWLEEELKFFYPWALLQSYIRHISYRPLLTKIFARWYGRRVGEFIGSELSSIRQQNNR